MSEENQSPGMETEFFGADDSFRFDCHQGLACFGQCCRDINIFLTPNDVIRLKIKLGISSTGFLRAYTELLEVPGLKFPFIYLKMNEGDLQCPFVTSTGCSVYQERPWSCRMAPVDIAGPGMFKFAFDRQKCLGLNCDKEWTVRQWMDSQDMDSYNTVEAVFKEIPFLVNFTGEESLDKRIAGLFKLVCFDVDRFREFALKKNYLIREGGGLPGLAGKMEDDVELLKAGIRWFLNVAGNKKVLKKVHVF